MIKIIPEQSIAELSAQPLVDTFTPAIMAASGPQKVHLDHLDGMRALAALYVMLCHAREIAYWNERKPTVLIDRTTGWMIYGHMAVSVFIVLSGFCLMLPIVHGNGVMRGGAKSFFMRRARRILPPYYCTLLLSIALGTTLISQKTGTAWDMSLPVTNMGIVAHLLLLQNIHRGMEINFPLWSVAVEWQIYFLFPLLVLGWARIGGMKTTLAVVLISYLGVFFLHNTRLAGLNMQYLALFGLGMLGCALSHSRQPKWTMLRERVPWTGAVFVCTGAIIFACYVWHTKTVMVYSSSIDLIVGLWTLSFLVAIAKSQEGKIRRALNCKPLVTIGTFSYSIYLLHMPLLQLAWQYGLCPLHLDSTTAFLLLITLGCLFVIVTAYLFYLLCERPFINSQART